MKHSVFTKCASLGAAFVLSAALLAGCTSSTSSVSTDQQANRAYMSQINELMDQATSQLDEFVEAVSSGDVVAMRTQADDAGRTLSQISSIEAPESLEGIQQNYIDGTTKLQEALGQYVDLYTETESGSLDNAAFQERLAEIQSLYNEGVASLRQGDEDAAALE